MGEYFPALESSKLSEGSMVAVDLRGKHLLLAKIGGEVFAVSGTCTHAESDLALGFVIEDQVVCPLHLSQFNLRTGQVLNPPATVPLQNFKVKIQDGRIFVEV